MQVENKSSVVLRSVVIIGIIVVAAAIIGVPAIAVPSVSTDVGVQPLVAVPSSTDVHDVPSAVVTMNEVCVPESVVRVPAGATLSVVLDVLEKRGTLDDVNGDGRVVVVPGSDVDLV